MICVCVDFFDSDSRVGREVGRGFLLGDRVFEDRMQRCVAVSEALEDATMADSAGLRWDGGVGGDVWRGDGTSWRRDVVVEVRWDEIVRRHYFSLERVGCGLWSGQRGVLESGRFFVVAPLDLEVC